MRFKKLASVTVLALATTLGGMSAISAPAHATDAVPASDTATPSEWKSPASYKGPIPERTANKKVRTKFDRNHRVPQFIVQGQRNLDQWRGGRTTIIGSGWLPNRPVTIEVVSPRGVRTTIATVTADRNGNFTLRGVVFPTSRNSVEVTQSGNRNGTSYRADRDYYPGRDRGTDPRGTVRYGNVRTGMVTIDLTLMFSYSVAK